MTSNFKRLENEMKLLEKESNLIIPNNNYYIIFLKFNVNNPNSLKLEEYSKKLLKDSKNQPFAVYIYYNQVAIFFSCREEEQEHFLGGNYQKLISYYVLDAVKFSNLKNEITCKIVLLESKTKFLIYLSWRAYKNSCKTMMRLSPKMNKKIAYNRTIDELIKDLNEKENIVWNELTKEERYGTFLKLKKKENQIIFSKLSGKVNLCEERKYHEFLFV